MLHEKKESLSKTAEQLEIKEEMRLTPVFEKVFLFQQGRTTRNITVDISTCDARSIAIGSLWQS
jgi:hypothetical protein